jgi:predicted RNA-binding protein YlqC (UPF0109 family)
MNSSIDQQFVEFVVKSLVSKPDAVQVERRIDEKGVLLELTVDPEDLGRVIGKRGATAQSLRTLLRALGTKNDARYNLKIVDNGEPRPERHYDEDHREETLANEKVEEVEGNTAEEQVTETEPAEEVNEVEEDSDRVSKTRKELEELDDLDV